MIKISKRSANQQNIGYTIYNRICDSLRSDILSGEFGVRQRLKVAELIERYGVSQMPIREALQKLEGEGLITIIPHHGAQVRGVSKGFIENIYDLRYAIENLLIRKALERMDEHILDQLVRAQDKYAQIARRKNRNIAEALEANRAFHEIHNKAAGNEEALAVLNRFWMILVNLRINLGLSARRVEEMMEEHKAMVEAFRKKDRNAIVAAHARHCENAKKDLLNLYHEKHP